MYAAAAAAAGCCCSRPANCSACAAADRWPHDWRRCCCPHAITVLCRAMQASVLACKATHIHRSKLISIGAVREWIPARWLVP